MHESSDIQLQNIPLDRIHSTPQNPRSSLDVDDELRGLARSMGQPEDGQMVEPPVVEDLGESSYRILAGERRIQAARLAGWTEIFCLVRPRLDPAQAHTLRLVENLQRKPLHPLDQAAALKIEWLYANAQEIEKGEQAREILGKEQTPRQCLAELSAMLAEHGFTPTHPAVTWDSVLDRLGIDLEPARRKKLLQVLAIDASVQERIGEIEITEAALRSLGQLEPDDQERLADELLENPDLSRKVRRISHAVRGHGYTLDQAIAEVHGQVAIEAEDHPEINYAPDEDLFGDNTMEVILQWLDVANQVTIAAQSLEEMLDGRSPRELTPPWNEYAIDATGLISQAITPLQD